MRVMDKHTAKSMQWNPVQQGIIWFVDQHESVLSEFYWVQLANPQSPQVIYIVWFHLYDILEKAKLWGWKTDEWFPGIMWKTKW